MKKYISLVLAAFLTMSVVAEVSAKSFSSGRSSFSSSRSFSKPAAVKSAPVVRSAPAAPKYSAPRVVSKPGKPAAVVSRPTVKSPAANTSFKRPVVRSAPVRKVTSPTTIRKTTIVQKNYYGSRYNGYANGGYNRNYGYGNGYGGNYGGGSGMGSTIIGSALGAYGGMMIYDALNGEDKPQEAVPQDSFTQDGAPVETPAEPTGFGQFVLPSDAPLMMDPSFYK